MEEIHRQSSLARAGRLDVNDIRDWLYENRRIVTALSLALCLAMTAAFLGLRTNSTAVPVEQSLPRASRPSVTIAAPVVVAHVSGAVAVPGVYQVAPGSRVADLVEAAGGLAIASEPDRVNLAAPVRDGDQVHIPSIEDTFVLDGESDPSIDVNRADVAALTDLPGIGPALAAAIIEHRTRHGPFGDLDALRAVSGIGPATVERLRDSARV